MRYEFTQPFASYEKWEKKDSNDSIYIHNVPLWALERIGIVKKVEEKKKPKFKVGDYVVVWKRFKKIWEVAVYGENFLYDGYLEKALRTPTNEELELYFR